MPHDHTHVRPDNRYLDLLCRADRERWCTGVSCTTCGSGTFVASLVALYWSDPRGLIEEVADTLLDDSVPSTFEHLDFGGALRLTLLHMLNRELVFERVLEASLHDARRLSWLIYYGSAGIPASTIGRAYEAAVALAFREPDTDLLETLLLRLPTHHPRFEEVLALGTARAARDRGLARVVAKFRAEVV